MIYDVEDESFFGINEELNQSIYSYFDKCIMYQVIEDMTLTINERSIIHVIFRKTIHYNKLWDRISLGQFQNRMKIKPQSLRNLLTDMAEKDLIIIRRSKGGRAKENRKIFNAYSLGMEFFEYYNPKSIKATKYYEGVQNAKKY